MPGVKSTAVLFLERRKVFRAEVCKVTSVDIAADSWSVSPVSGDQVSAWLFSPGNVAVQAKSMAEAVSKKIGEPSTDAHDQLGMFWLTSCGLRQLVVLLGCQSRSRMLKVHCPAMYPDFSILANFFATPARATSRSESYVRSRAVYSVTM